MGEESPKPASTPTGAVFLSYASQDAEAAQRICAALRSAGVEVWFDQSELRGGDTWDRQIRKQIHDCALFVPVISVHSDARREGYFRREWKLAVDRTADMAEDVAFLLPVVIDSTPDATARVPDRFREAQWSRLPDGQTSPAFIERVRRLLSPEASTATQPSVSAVSGAAPGFKESVRVSQRFKPLLLAIVAVVGSAALAYVVASKFWTPKHTTPETAVGANRSAAPFAPPAHSIAVLPFVNMSGDKEQEYFSDGLTEELLNSLTRVDELQVAGRTSSFYFKGEHADLATIARRLNVANVLEGSVRRSGNTVRITAQLVNAVTGFHAWSQTYDRDLGDILKLQTEIANAVAGALRVTLLGDVAGKIEVGGTRNPAAFDAYLRGAAAARSMGGAESEQAAIAEYTEAIRLDPSYALAYAARATMEVAYAQEFATGSTIAQGMARALADGNKALTLAPDLAEGHEALAGHAGASLEFARALEEHERAVALAPGNAALLGEYGRFAGDLGLTERGLAAAQRAVLLDPLNPRSHYLLGQTLHSARRYGEATRAYEASIRLNADSPYARAFNGLNEYAQGNLQRASELCEARPSQWSNLCLAVAYEKLGRRAEARVSLDKIRSAQGDDAAYQYAEIHTQWGDLPAALDWLEKALRLRDPGLVTLRTDTLLDPLRNEPRFQAIEHALKFPN
jgi:TolB-like protein/Tfp pilus assembly protein PilF